MNERIWYWGEQKSMLRDGRGRKWERRKREETREKEDTGEKKGT